VSRGTNAITNGIIDTIMTTIVEIDKAGRIVVPKRLRDALRVRAGDQFVVEEKDDGIFLQPKHEAVRLVQRDDIWVMAGGPPSRKSAVELIEEDRERRMKYVSGESDEP
jgi:AbrB family looped-hinge helix DNA binding protein